jgi:hypothetical protein
MMPDDDAVSRRKMRLYGGLPRKQRPLARELRRPASSGKGAAPFSRHAGQVNRCESSFVTIRLSRGAPFHPSIITTS